MPNTPKIQPKTVVQSTTSHTNSVVLYSGIINGQVFYLSRDSNGVQSFTLGEFIKQSHE